MKKQRRTIPEARRLVQSLLAGWRVSLHRTRADWPIVAAAWLITRGPGPGAAVRLALEPDHISVWPDRYRSAGDRGGDARRSE